MINAALALAAKPNSKVAQDNMDLFKEQWEKQVRVLTDAVDDITSIDDFLCVSGEPRSSSFFWSFHSCSPICSPARRTLRSTLPGCLGQP